MKTIALLAFEERITKELLDIIDKKIEELYLSSKNEWDPDAMGTYDSMEKTIGLGFVICQNYITSVYSLCEVEKNKALQRGLKHKNGLTLAKIVNDLANYWKHNQEWVFENNKKHKKNIESTFSKIGFPVHTDYPSANILYELTKVQDNAFSVIFEKLLEWKRSIIQSV